MSGVSVNTPRSANACACSAMVVRLRVNPWVKMAAPVMTPLGPYTSTTSACPLIFKTCVLLPVCCSGSATAQAEPIPKHVQKSRLKPWFLIIKLAGVFQVKRWVLWGADRQLCFLRALPMWQSPLIQPKGHVLQHLSVVQLTPYKHFVSTVFLFVRLLRQAPALRPHSRPSRRSKAFSPSSTSSTATPAAAAMASSQGPRARVPNRVCMKGA
jgi:hypothetical protein